MLGRFRATSIAGKMIATTNDRRRLALDFCRERAQREQAERRRLSAAVESLQTQLRIAVEIETLRRDEYKRLLKLQGDEIVTAEESKRGTSIFSPLPPKSNRFGQHFAKGIPCSTL